MVNEQEGAKRALVVAAHPDDAEFGCAGTAALWSREGWEFYYLICTDGSKGTDRRDLPPRELVAMRRDEQRAAAQRLGVKEVFFLDWEDGALTDTQEFLGQVVRYIRQLKPRAVFTHDPTVLFHGEGFINHSDHRCAGLVATDAVYPTARDHLYFPEQLSEGLEPHKVQELYCWGSNEANYSVDITDVLQLKLRALLDHKSQFTNREEIVEWASTRWKNEEGRYVENFRRIVMLF